LDLRGQQKEPGALWADGLDVGRPFHRALPPPRHKIPPEYQGCFCYAGEWSTYAQVFPAHHLHQQQVKGPTNHLERFNLTLRQRLSRLIRKTLSFSKSLKMHLICLRRFFLRYNLDQADRYLKSTPT
jgi:hypothetical protein